MAVREALTTPGALDLQEYIANPQVHRFEEIYDSAAFFDPSNLRAKALLIPQVDDPKGRNIFEIVTPENDSWVLKFYPSASIAALKEPPSRSEYSELANILSELENIPEDDTTENNVLHSGAQLFIKKNWDLISAMMNQDESQIVPAMAFLEVKIVPPGLHEVLGGQPDVIGISPDGTVTIIELAANNELKPAIKRYAKSRQVRSAGRVFEEKMSPNFPIRLYSALYKVGKTNALELSFKEVFQNIQVAT